MPLRGRSGISSVLVPLPGRDPVGGGPKQDLLWEWAASQESLSSLASVGPGGGGPSVGRRGWEGRAGAWETVSAPGCPSYPPPPTPRPWRGSLGGTGAEAGISRQAEAGIEVQRAQATGGQSRSEQAGAGSEGPGGGLRGGPGPG